MLFSMIQTSQAELWQFVVEVQTEKGAVDAGDTVVVTGRVVNHAYEPTRGVEVFIRTGADTTKAFTDPDGVFRGDFRDFQRIPGTYTVNVIASWYGMTGMSSTEFQVNGDYSHVSELQQKLSTEEARKYLGSNESDFEKNPIGQTLFKYYHKLLDELIQENKQAQKPDEEKIFLEQQRRIAENLRNQAIEEQGVGAGTYGGLQYEDYIKSLKPEIRELVISQLNFTKNNFEEAQSVRDNIIANGGTYEEAKKAYLEIISIPREILEQFNEKQLDEEQLDEEQLDEEQLDEEQLDEEQR
jgi:hypothetical protein